MFSTSDLQTYLYIIMKNLKQKYQNFNFRAKSFKKKKLSRHERKLFMYSYMILMIMILHLDLLWIWICFLMLSDTMMMEQSSYVRFLLCVCSFNVSSHIYLVSNVNSVRHSINIDQVHILQTFIYFCNLYTVYLSTKQTIKNEMCAR